MKYYKTLITVLFLGSLVSSVSLARGVCVKNDWANLRNGPGRNHKKTWMVYQYMPFKLLKTTTEWLKVEDQDGDQHWIFKPLITESLHCAATNKNGTPVKAGPGEDEVHKSYSPVPRYYAVKVLKTEGDWVQVQDQDNEIGWIHKDHLWMP